MGVGNRSLPCTFFAISLGVATPASAQPAEPVPQEEQSSPDPEQETREGDFTLDLTLRTSDSLYQQRCNEQADAARIAGEIVVCRQLGEESDGSWNSEQWRLRYAEETALRNAPRAPDFILDCADQGWPVGCVKVGPMPDPIVMIDIEALPEAPPDSDAERAGQGLAPLPPRP